MSLKGRTGEITVHEAHVKVDGCGGPVSVRFLAYAQISTDNGNDNGRRVVVAGMAAAVVALASAGAATADNSNNNTNTNDVTNVIGSAVTGGPSNENANWPPTDLSWPPNEIMNSGEGESDGNDSSGSTPIVMPAGQPAPTKTATPSTQQAQPIVPVNAP